MILTTQKLTRRNTQKSATNLSIPAPFDPADYSYRIELNRIRPNQYKTSQPFNPTQSNPIRPIQTRVCRLKENKAARISAPSGIIEIIIVIIEVVLITTETLIASLVFIFVFVFIFIFVLFHISWWWRTTTTASRCTGG